MKAAMPFTISDLRQCPEFFDIVAERIWQAWWKADGHPFDYISGRLRENLSDTPIPFALVAHDGETFLGTASVIASDLAERPQFTPWVAAVGSIRGRAGAASVPRWSTAQRSIASHWGSAAPIYARGRSVRATTKDWAGPRSNGMSDTTAWAC